MKRTIAAFVLICAAGTATTQPIEVAGDVFALGNHAFPAKVEVVGYEVTSGSIADSNTYLEGANLQGWSWGMNQDSQYKMIFQAPIEDQAGDDLYFGQGRMLENTAPTGDRHALEFSFDGNTWHYLGHADFTMASSYWYNTVTHPTWYYQLYRSSVDLADYGVTDPITEVYVRGASLVQYETVNLVLVGNLNDGVEADNFKPLVNLFPEAVSYVQNGKVRYNGFYSAKIFAHDAAGIKNNLLYQRVKGATTWVKVDTDNNLSNTIGGHYGGYYQLFFDYNAYPAGTVLQFKQVTLDKNNNRTVIIKKARVLKNHGLRFLN